MTKNKRQKSKFRVLMVSARSDIGGGPAHMFALAQGLLSEGTLFAALPDDGIFFERFIHLVGSGNVFTIPRQEIAISAIWGLRCWCLENRINLIHSHGKGAGIYSRLLGVMLGLPVVHTLHGYHDGRYATWLKHLYAFWESLAGIVTRRIVCVSVSESAVFKRKVYVLPAKLVIIPNGTEVQSRSPVQPQINKIVTVARFDFQKNLPEFLQVAQRLPAYIFLVFGDGGDRPEIESELIKKNIANVRLCGARQKVLEHISDAALYLTTARWEGLPLAVLEAMSLGVPVVASDVVGNRDAVSVGVTGYLYPLGDVSEAVLRIDKALKLDRSEIQNYHRRHFSAERMVAQTSKLYKEVLE